MAKNETADESEVKFTKSDLMVLRNIVADWIYEETISPPYPPEIVSVIEKLGVPGKEHKPEHMASMRATLG